MIIDFELEHQVSKDPLLVRVVTSTDTSLLNLNQSNNSLRLNLKLPIQNQDINLAFECDNLSIIKHPLTIKKIVLDEFYQSPKILFRGKPNFDKQFLAYAAKNNIALDFSVKDSNRLDFTGALEFQFCWPFYKNAFL